MTNFTLNNHLKYSIGGREYGFRENVYEKFTVSVGSIDPERFSKTSWRDEQFRTAEIVLQEFGKDLVVMFSGGTDSEIVLRAFKSIGFDPKPVFINFTGGYNYNDYLYAVNIAKTLELDLEIVEFDILDFFRSGQAAEFAAEIQCKQMAYLSVYHNIKKIGRPAVMGGELLLKLDANIQRGAKWYYCFRENEDASAIRFSNKYGIPLVNEWFSYTPEMMLHYMNHPTTDWLINTKTNGKLASVSTKNKILHSYIPQLTKKTKTHGFERLMGFNGEAYQVLSNTHPKRLESSLDGIFIDEFVRKLKGENNASN